MNDPEEMKFRLTYKTFFYSNEETTKVICGLENALRIYRSKCEECEKVIMEKLNS